MRLHGPGRGGLTLVLFSITFVSGACGCADAQEFTYDSSYAHYIIRKAGTIVEMRHLSKRSEWLESAVDLNDLRRPVVPYTTRLFAAAFFKDQPRHAMMIGLGGGSFNHLFNATYPEATLHTVEIDKLALDLSKKHMGFEESDRNVVTVRDGRQFVKRSQQQWDWIILDAFHAGHVPFHLKTKEFYEQIRKVLSPDGLLISNLHSGTMLYEADIKTLLASFPQVMLFRVRDRGNVIAVAANYSSPKMADQLPQCNPASAPAILRKYINLEEVRADRVSDIHRETSDAAQVLTDDYCPAEYLNSQER